MYLYVYEAKTNVLTTKFYHVVKVQKKGSIYEVEVEAEVGSSLATRTYQVDTKDHKIKVFGF